MGPFLKAVALTLCLGERRKLEALKRVLHLLPGCFCEALLELKPVSTSWVEGTSGNKDSQWIFCLLVLPGWVTFAISAGCSGRERPPDLLARRSCAKAAFGVCCGVLDN